jgi:hypothetical protein
MLPVLQYLDYISVVIMKCTEGLLLTLLSQCHVLTLVTLFCLCFSMVRACVGVGSLCLFFYVGFCVQPSMVLNQR